MSLMTYDRLRLGVAAGELVVLMDPPSWKGLVSRVDGELSLLLSFSERRLSLERVIRDEGIL